MTLMLEQGTPESREVRLEQGITQGPLEDQLYRVYSGNTEDLLKAIVASELIIENERRKAAEEYKRLLTERMRRFGNLVMEDLTSELENFKENEVYDIHQMGGR